MLYKGLLTSAIAQRIQVLSQALQWYDGAIEYVVKNKKVMPSGHKELTKGAKTRELGIRTNFLEERETAFRQTLRHYERFCIKLRPTHVDKFYSVYMAKRKKLAAKASRLDSKHEHLTRMIEDALPGSGLKIKVIDNAVKPRHYDGEGTFSYSAEHADKMRRIFRREGLLALVVQEIQYIARAMATSPDGSGGFVHDPKKQNDAYVKLLMNFVKYCKSVEAPRRLIRREEAAPSSTSKGKKSFGRAKGPSGYTPGSCIEFLYNRLSNGQPWTKKDLFKGAPSKGEDPLRRLKKHGELNGEWEIKIAEDVIQMVRTK